MNEIRETPLVSVVVITYLSEKYILETLESIKAQNYQNIELIISDDGSHDSTVLLCKQWIADNKTRFFTTEIITVPVNTGIPSNVNRGVKASQGEWIKYIAGDDILLPDCISSNLNFALDNNISFLFSKPVYIDDDSEIIEDTSKLQKYNDNDEFYNLNAKQQFLSLLYKRYPMSPPTCFLKKYDLDKIGWFSEEFLNEDFPLYLKVTKAGYKLYFMNKETVLYRKHATSISSIYQNEQAITIWEKTRLEKTIRVHITYKLFLSNPLIYIDFYNRLLYSKIIIFLGNKKKVKYRLSFFRWLSPLYFKERVIIKIKKVKK